ncbi:hypothetical protein J056_004642 [Wallemia ichthyophaga EXF-994]|uniref:Uncharacterized protein n=1 Tax=Wallemia ichthyophaga (strain EXF-994 / CBS 113033) TaxID=1299270 RepID=R9A983_WALI9|nr:uncharacterized protein J056_004642 [Wallemia ichthyophaga EXF-994]EOQ98624.1 hypothetical protein J056_004642 [Wallemia ichthyophaga EXF-994]
MRVNRQTNNKGNNHALPYQLKAFYLRFLIESVKIFFMIILLDESRDLSIWYPVLFII